MSNFLKLMKEKEKFIKKHDFKNYSIKGIEKIIGDELTIKLTNSFAKDEDDAIKWFYSPAPRLGGKTPNEYYKINETAIKYEIEDLYWRPNFFNNKQ